LTIRGPGKPDYLQGLAALAAAVGVSARVTMDPPVPTGELVSAAASHDIGLMALPGHSAHNAFALPNKVFEYLMAGLAICVTDLPSMAALVRATGAGVLAGDGSEHAIAAALRDLTPERIDAMKRRALEAAKELHFDTDAAPVCRLYEAALAASRGHECVSLSARL
jgi:glycosyltransferase involved in cell wall biosynthesis